MLLTFIPTMLNASPLPQGPEEYPIMFFIITFPVWALLFAWLQMRISFEKGAGYLSLLAWIPILNLILMNKVAKWSWAVISSLVLLNVAALIAIFYDGLNDASALQLITAYILFTECGFLSLILWAEVVRNAKKISIWKLILVNCLISAAIMAFLIGTDYFATQGTRQPVPPPAEPPIIAPTEY